ncbi:MAG: PadR family transcriptional regulator [Thermoguttaceae bacterium]|nr:PadR family transcriptional regulator [Thermoguttaceae bacterium]
MKYDQCPCSGKNLAKLVRPAVLALLSERPMHGYELATEIGNHGWSGAEDPDLSGIYRVLNDCEKQGHVVSHWDASQRGSARKVYSLTPEGRQCLIQWHATLAAYLKQLSDLNDYIAATPCGKSPRQKSK